MSSVAMSFMERDWVDDIVQGYRYSRWFGVHSFFSVDYECNVNTLHMEKEGSQAGRWEVWMMKKMDGIHPCTIEHNN